MSARKRKHDEDEEEVHNDAPTFHEENEPAAAATASFSLSSHHEEEKKHQDQSSKSAGDEEDTPLRPSAKRLKSLSSPACTVIESPLPTMTPLSPPVSTEEYTLARQAFDRAMFTDELMRSISRISTPLLVRVSCYVRAMEEDATRDVPRIDINHRRKDTGDTLLMTLTKLFGELCHPAPPVVKYDLFAIDGPMNGGLAKKHLLKLMDHMDVSAKNCDGQTALQVLCNHIIINAQVYFDWYVLEKLLSLGASIEEKWGGQTPLMRSSAAGGTPFFPQRLLKHGADLTTKDNFGRNILHAMVACDNERMVKALLFENIILLQNTGWWLEPDSKGETALKLAARRSNSSSSIFHMINTAQLQWEKQIQPLLLAELRPCLVGDLAKIVCEYIDGSGSPWPKIEPKDQDSIEEQKESEIESNENNDQDAQEEAMEIEEEGGEEELIDPEVDDMEPSDSEGDELDA